MTDVKLNDFQPGQEYSVQVRTKSVSDPDKVSEWSNVYRFSTTNDLIAPKPVTGLTFVPQGSSFIAKWSAPFQNANGSTCKDLAGYWLFFKNATNPTEITRQIFTADTSYTLDFLTNKELFGVARGVVTINVVAVDQVGNRSTPVETSATNPRPADVTGLVVTDAIESLNINWDKNNVDLDLVGYEVHVSTVSSTFTPGPGTLKFSGPGTSYVLPTSNPVPHHVKVRAVDIFNLVSVNDAYGVATPRTTTSSDGTPPGVPTNIVIASQADGRNAAINLSWTPPADTDLDHFDIRYSTDNLDWSYLTVPSGTNSTKILGLRPATAYYVSIRAVDYSANKSIWVNAPTFPLTTGADTTPIPTPSAPIVMAGVSKLLLAHSLEDTTGTFMTDIARLEIHMQNDDGIQAPGVFSRLAEITTSGATFGVSTLVSLVTEPDTEYYWYVVAVGENGLRSDPSPMALSSPGLIEGAYIADATIDDAKINTLSANKLQANSAFINDLFIRSKLSIDDATGSVESSTFNVGTQTGWRINRNGITIYDGTIKASALEIQNSANIIQTQFSSFEFNREYYTNVTTFVPNTNALTVSQVSSKVDVSPVSKFGNQSLRFWDTTNAANNKITFAKTGTWPVEVAGGQTYISSIHVKNNLAASKTIELVAEAQNGESFTTTAVIPANSNWVRVSVVGQWGITVTGMRLAVNSPAGAPIDFLFDGAQIERKIGSLSDPSPWSPNGQTAIDGGSIITGSIRSNVDGTIPGQPAWSLNTQGNLQVGDALVRGSMTVGAGADTTNSIIKSSDFSAGSSGWMINGAGNVEFNSGIFRGTLGAGIVTATSLSANIVLSDRIVAGVANGPRVEMMGGTGADAGLVAYSAATTKSLQINTSGVFTSYNTSGQRTLDIDASGNFRTYNPTTQASIFTLSNTGTIAIANASGNTFTASAAGDVVIRGIIKTADSGARIEIQPGIGITFYASTTSTSPRNYTRWAHTVFTDYDSVSKAGFTINSPSIQALRFYTSTDTRQFYSTMSMAASTTEMWSFRVREEANGREHSRMMIRAKDVEVIAGPTVNAETTDAAYVQNNWAPMLYMPWGGHAGAGTPGKPIILLSHLKNNTGNTLLHRSGFQSSVDPNVTAVIYSQAGLILRDFTNQTYTTFTAGDINGGIIKYNQLVQNTSGVQFKENFEKIPEPGLDVLRNAPVSRWNYKEKPEEARIGPIATDLPDWLTVASTELFEEEEVAGEFTTTKVMAKRQENSSYELTSIIGVLWEAVRELDEELDEYRRERGLELPKRRSSHKVAKAQKTWVEAVGQLDTEETK